MALKKITKITNKQIAEKGVQALADRPNLTAQYGASGLSAAQLKLWFDKLATFLAERINEISDAISSDEATNYIRVCLDDYGVDNLGALITAFIDGDFADKILQLAPSASQQEKQTLQSIINSIAQELAKIKERLGEIDSFNDELLKTLDKHNDNITKNKDDIVVLDSKIQSHGDRIFRIEEGIAGGFGFEFNQLKDSMEKQDEKLSARINENAENIEMLKAFAVEKNDLVLSEIEDSYDIRITAAGGNVADNSRATLKKVEGNTVACHNLINIDVITTANLYNCTMSADKKITLNEYKNSRLLFIGTTAWEEFKKFFNIKGAGKYRLSYKTTGTPVNWRLKSSSTENKGMPINGTFEITEEDIAAYKSLVAGQNISIYMDGANGDIISDIQIVAGEEEKPYVPYYTGLKNASFKGITSTGRNLFNILSNFESDQYTVSGNILTILESAENGYVTCIYKLPAGNYFLSGIGGSIAIESYVNGVVTNPVYGVTLTGSLAFTVPENAELVRIFFYATVQGGGSYEKIMLNFGDTALPFEPYVEDTLELPAAVECGLGTMIDFENRKIINRGVDIVLTGNETIDYVEEGTYPEGNVFTIIGVLTSPERLAKYVCTDAVQLSGSMWKDGGLWVGVDNTHLYWLNPHKYLGLAKGTDIEQDKFLLIEYLKQRYESGNPVKIRYVASTGTETELDNNATYMTRKDGMETVLGNENREYVNNTLTQEYFEYAGGEEV